MLAATLILAIMVLRPVPSIAEKEALATTGVITEIFEDNKDIFFTLHSSDRLFYINRGIDQGFNVSHFQQTLIGKREEIKYPSYWTPLDWRGQIKHLSQLSLYQAIVFSEFKN